MARGQFSVGSQRVDLKSVRVPMFVVGTETDHVAPWQSVYKARVLTSSADYTLCLTSGGHNAGIVSGPAHPKRRHRLLTWSNGTDSLTPEEWLKAAPHRRIRGGRACSAGWRSTQIHSGSRRPRSVLNELRRSRNWRMHRGNMCANRRKIDDLAEEE
jgi:hypothetical protein